MADCRWLKPVLVGQFEFLEWSGDNHLRHSKFVALREDKSAGDVKREENSAEPMGVERCYTPRRHNASLCTGS